MFSEKNKEYLFVFMVVAASGIVFFNGDAFVVIFFLATFFAFLLQKKKFHATFLLFLALLLTLITIQGAYFGEMPYSATIGLLMKIGIGYFALALVPDNFTRRYVDILYFLAICSLVFFIPILLGGGAIKSIFESIAIRPPLGGGYENFIVYTLNLEEPGILGLPRNCGAFWEPAAFGGYLIVGLIFNLIHTNSVKDKKSVILIITLVTTLSTTIFVVLAFLLFCYYLINGSVIAKIAVIPILGGIVYFAFTSFEFLGDKIEEQLDLSNIQSKAQDTGGQMSHTRFSSAVADWEDISKHPIMGRGIYPITFHYPGDLASRHNGLTRFIAEFGAIISIIYFGLILMTFNKLCANSPINSQISLFFFACILLIGFSENLFSRPFFWALAFLLMFPVSNNEEEEDVPENNEAEYTTA